MSYTCDANAQQRDTLCRSAHRMRSRSPQTPRAWEREAIQPNEHRSYIVIVCIKWAGRLRDDLVFLPETHDAGFETRREDHKTYSHLSRRDDGDGLRKKADDKGRP